MNDLKVTYRAYAKAAPPQPIRLQIGGWAGSPQKLVDGSQPQPWHCLPFVEGSTFGLELVYPYETECHVVGANGTLVFEWDFAKEPGGGVTGAEFIPFEPADAAKYYFFNTGLDLMPPPGYVIRTAPHPRFFTDETGTVPMPMIGHLQNEWYPRRMFVVFRGPRQGQRHIFRKNEPYAQILFVPQRVKYDIGEMSDEEAARRRDLERDVGSAKTQIAENIWHNPTGAVFNDHYKVLSRAFARDGQAGVESAIREAMERQRQSLPAERSIAECIEEGNRLLSQDRYDEARAIFDHVLSREPNNAEALSRVAVVCWCTKLPMVALRLMSQAASLEPKSAARHAELGHMLRMLGRHREAEAAYRSALALKPGDAEIMSYLALMLAHQGRAGEGLQLCRAARALSPQSPIGPFMMGLILAQQGQHAEARACYQAALAIDPNNADARRGLEALRPEVPTRQ